MKQHSASVRRPQLEILEDRITPSFTPATGSPFPVGTTPVSVAVGDFNGDGKADLATANSGSTTVSVLLGTGNGSFSAASDFAVGSSPRGVAVGDFNGDGRQDLAVANNGSNNVSVLLGDGAGAFSAASGSPFTVGSAPRSVAVGDFNGDGRQDLAVSNLSSNNVSVLLGDGTGSFSAPTNFAVGSSPLAVAVGDLNGDGRQDLAVANLSSNDVSVLLGDGAGSFSAPTNFSVGTNARGVAVGDFNGDGRQDLAVAAGADGTVSVLLGDGAGSFFAASSFAVEPTPTSVAVGDFNGDGRQDLAVANNGSNNVSVLLGDGTGSFSSASGSPFTVGSNPSSVAVGDFNGDGRADLASDNFPNTVSVLLNGIASEWKGLEVAPPAPAPVFTTDANANFVLDLYRTVLGRLPEATGLAFWDGRLDSTAMTRTQVVDAFFGSLEHYTRQVRSFYARFLGRAGDAEGVQNWVNAILNGASEREVILGFVLSAEYQQANATDAAFVQALYPAVLGRASDAAGVTNWTTMLGNGTSRRNVALGFLASQESAQEGVRGFFRSYLGRNAGDAELAPLVGQALGQGTASIAHAILASAEFSALPR